MKRVILILIALIMNAYAGNCYRMPNDELRKLESSFGDATLFLDGSLVSQKLLSGVRCENAMFLNMRVLSESGLMSESGCISYIGNFADVILTGRFHYRAIIDEFDMPIKTISDMSKNASCEKLYLDFKSKVK
jgi:hypothetical protein